MKCPLFVITDKRTQLGEESDYCECLKEECAWWEKPLGVCCIRAQEATLGVMLEQLTKLIGKMPHELQFRK